MRDILLHVPLSEKTDLPRFWDVLDELIDAKKLPKKKKYPASKKRVKDLKDFCGDAIIDGADTKSSDDNNMQSLISKIKGKNAGNGEDFFSYLEEKYNPKPKKRKKNK